MERQLDTPIPEFEVETVRTEKPHVLSGWGRVVIGIVTLLTASCSKPEEVISTRVSLANQDLAAKNTEEAIEVLEKLNEKYPDQPVVLEALGFAYAQANRHRAAAASFVRVADIDPASETLRQQAAEAYLRNGSFDDAAEQLRLYLAEFPADAQSWKKLGEIEERRGDLARAVDAYVEWYRIQNSGDAAFRLGMAFRKLNNSPQAKAWLETTIRHGDAHIKEALLGLLELELEAGDIAAAERSVRQIDDNFPGSLDESPLALVRGRIAAWREADATLAKARAEQERVAQELEALRRQQAEELARADSESTGEIPVPPAPTPASTGPATAEELPPTAATSTAAPADASLSQIEPEPGELTDLHRAQAKRVQGDVDGAIADLMRILDLDQMRADAWLELAHAHQELGQADAAAAYMLEARRRAPQSLEIEIAYLNLLRETKSHEAYLDGLQLARERFPANANLAYALASELGKSEGRTIRAVAAYEDFLLLAGPTDPRRAEATEFLARSRP